MLTIRKMIKEKLNLEQHEAETKKQFIESVALKINVLSDSQYEELPMKLQDWGDSALYVIRDMNNITKELDEIIETESENEEL